VHMPHRGILRCGPVLPSCRRSCGWPPCAVPTRVAEGASDFWVLDLLILGPLLRAHASLVSSPTFFAPPMVFQVGSASRWCVWCHAPPVLLFSPPIFLALSWVCLLIFGRVVRGLWWVCWVEVVSGLVWVFVGGFYCILGFMWASGVVGPCGFSSILFVG
jgi:hypothetical protein